MFRRFAIYYAAFASGAAIMALEVIGLGMLAPYFGTALLIQTNVIGIVLISLAIGYRLGGVWADTQPPKLLERIFPNKSERAVGMMLCIAALWVGIVFPWRGPLSSLIGWAIPTNSLGSFLTTSILFAFPGVVLGMVLPYLIKLHTQEIRVSGKSSGILYGLSAAGSIFGTFLIGLFILPQFQYGIALAGIVLLLVPGAFLLNVRWQYTAITMTISILLLLGFTPPDFVLYKHRIFSDGRIKSDMSEWKKLADRTSIFSRLQVYEGTELESKKPLRFLLVNGEIHSASYLDSNELVFAYAHYNRLGGHFNPAAKRALLIGGGAYSYANYFLTDTPLYDTEKVWELAGNLYHNSKTITLPILFSYDSTRRDEKPSLVYESSTKPIGRQIEGSLNHLEANNQMPGDRVVVKEADILDTSFTISTGYVHIHETSDDGTPGRVISADIPVKDYMQRPRAIIGKSQLISGKNKDVIVRLDRTAKEGEVLYPMLHRDNGNGHFDEFLLDGYEQIEGLDVVEIDPRTTELSEKFFHLNRQDPRLRIFHEDGRTYLNHSTDTYDIIYLDAFQSFYGVPWQLTTAEATKKLFTMLNDNGIVIANVPAALKGTYSGFFQAEFKTYQSVFPEVRAYAVTSPKEEETVQNIILVAFKNEETIRTSPNDNSEIADQLTHRWYGSIDPKTPILTDDFAPTDYFASTFVNLHSL
ncbi:MAG: fused MFS/spermidine synthase [bacterium]|nr:fused MFS/spermidine synthase [bacterium]